MDHIQDIYKLSPMQEGMLFHALQDPGEGLYIEQVLWTLEGALDVAALESAWRWVMERHAVLRTAIHWREVKTPVQVVFKQVDLPWRFLDWRSCESGQRQAQLDAFLAADRQEGIDLSQASLMRLQLIQYAEDAFYLLWTHHHILLDGWSFPILIQDLFAAYQKALEGQTPQLPAPRPYREYIHWLRQQNLSEAERYWRESLSGFEGAPLYHKRGTEKGTPIQARLRLSTTATSAIKDFARRQQVTLNTVVQGAWALLLSHYSAQEDVLFGVTVSGRPADLPGVEGMVGLFINTLPLRVRLSGEEKVGAWLRALQDQLTALRNYEYTPLSQVRQWSDAPHGEALFESIVVFENYPVQTRRLGDAAASVKIRLASSQERTNYPLTLVVAPGEEVALRLSSNSRYYTEVELEGMLRHLETMLLHLPGYGEQRLAELPLLSAKEEQALLFQGEHPRQRPVPYQHIGEAFLAVVQAHPDCVAVEAVEGAWTYRVLDHVSSHIAQRLVNADVRPGEVVGLGLERGIVLVAAMLGVLKAGAVYLPLDLSYPRIRLETMLENARLLLCDEGAEESFSALSLPVLLIGATPSCSTETLSWEAPLLSGTAPAYLMYSSGSTGRPKGSLIPHQAILNLVLDTDYVDFTAEEGVAQTASVSFDAATFEIWGALLNGGRLVFTPLETLLDSPAMERFLNEKKIAKLFLSTALFHQLAKTSPALFSGLDYLIIGGEAADPAIVRYVLHAGAPRQFINGYGPTETTTFATSYDMRRLPEDAGRTPIGKPIRGVLAYVLDRRLRLLPHGAPGELYLGGLGLGLGYQDLPEQSAASFIENPFSKSAGRLYKTGDRVRWNAQGELEFLGRLDHQVKLRGFRIELGEIEAVLRTHAGVRDVVVLLHQAGEPRLAAYVEGESLDGGSLRSFLQSRLPAYMLPASFQVLTRFPLNRNGKVDRGALAALPLEEESRAEGRSPETEVERTMAALWKELLGKPCVDVAANFFDLGGHSLLIVRLCSRIQESFQVDIPLQAIFANPSIAALSAMVERSRSGEEVLLEEGKAYSPIVAPLRTGGRRPPLFCVGVAGGVIFPYYGMAYCFDAEQPLYALQDPAFATDSPPYKTVEEQAAKCIAAMREVQPKGPYYLFGWSFAGTVALEMAQQLRAAGEQVPILAVLDAPLGLPEGAEKNGNLRAFRDVIRAFRQQFYGAFNFLRDGYYTHARYLLSSEQDSTGLWNWLKLAPARLLWQCFLKRAEIDRIISEETQLTFLRQPDTRRFFKIFFANVQALLRYHPKHYAGAVILYLAKDVPGAGAGTEAIECWRDIAQGGVTECYIPGDHMSVIRNPNVDILVEHLAAALEAAEASGVATFHSGKQRSLANKG